MNHQAFMVSILRASLSVYISPLVATAGGKNMLGHVSAFVASHQFHYRWASALDCHGVDKLLL